MASPSLKVLAFTAVLALGLAACGDGSETTQTAPPSINISAPSDGGGESSPSDGGGGETDEAAPEIPAPDPADYPGKDQETPEGAEQAFRYYWAVQVWSSQTGETDKLENLSSEECVACTEYFEAIELNRESDRLWHDANISDEASSIASSGDGEFSHIVLLEFTLSEHQEFDSELEQLATVSEQRYRSAAGMNWVDGSWVLDELSLTPLELSEGS